MRAPTSEGEEETTQTYSRNAWKKLRKSQNKFAGWAAIPPPPGNLGGPPASATAKSSKNKGGKDWLKGGKGTNKGKSGDSRGKAGKGPCYEWMQKCWCSKGDPVVLEKLCLHCL